MLFQLNSTLSSIISLLVVDRKEAIILGRVIFDRRESLAIDGPIDMNILSAIPLKDIQRYSADS